MTASARGKYNVIVTSITNSEDGDRRVATGRSVPAYYDKQDLILCGEGTASASPGTLISIVLCPKVGCFYEDLRILVMCNPPDMMWLQSNTNA